jgi:hypothetical protein
MLVPLIVGAAALSVVLSARSAPSEGSQHAALTCDAAHLMPNLRDYVLRSNPHVQAQGRSIKGDYYSWAGRGPFDLVAFRAACDAVAALAPFLVFEFETQMFHVDFDGDGCADIVGHSTDSTIDPADFYPLALQDDARCYEDRVSSLALRALDLPDRNALREEVLWFG